MFSDSVDHSAQCDCDEHTQVHEKLGFLETQCSFRRGDGLNHEWRHDDAVNM